MFREFYAKMPSTQQVTLKLSELFPEAILKTIYNMRKPQENQSAFLMVESMPRLMHEALTYFLKGNYNLFDPLVGDTSCQIRAFELSRLGRDLNKCLLFKKRARALKELLDYLDDQKKSFRYTKGDTIEYTLFQLLETYAGTFSCSEEERFIMQCYMLTLTKNQEETKGEPLKEKTDYKALRHSYGVSGGHSRKIVLYNQKMITEYSVKLIAQYAESEAEHHISTSNRFLIKDSKERLLLPQYVIMGVLMNAVKQSRQHILLKVERFVCGKALDINHFTYAFDGNNFIPTDLVTDQDIPCIVLEGFVKYDALNKVLSQEEYKKKIMSMNVEDIVMASLAAHPQYPGEHTFDAGFEQRILTYNQDNSGKNDKDSGTELNTILMKYYEHKHFANQEGCCLENPDLCTLIHIYCDSVKKQITTPTELNTAKLECELSL